MYDVVGGGFARYSVDEQWLVPHFEKMLYDNAQLALVYLQAHILTGDASFKRVAMETLDFTSRELDASGGRILFVAGCRLRGGRGSILRLDRCRDPSNAWVILLCMSYLLRHTASRAEATGRGTSSFSAHWMTPRWRQDFELTTQQVEELLARSRSLLYAGASTAGSARRQTTRSSAPGMG